ncbi:hypothetical protein HPP92_020278 [Vanilla planifolia]|uniref:Glycosyltransferase n=1 Tax=Vanilla planifolia TaxID=51239 RepID=A0A835Q227_VANPL|nr:hypothetical protein HPP92_020278 [Vanilla planifolia]
MASSASDLHIFFLPLPAPGHTIPMVDLALLFANLGASSTVVATPYNASLILPSISSHPKVQILTVPSPYPSIPENITSHSIPDVSSEFFDVLCLLEPHLDQLLSLHRPDALVSDLFFPWSASLAVEHRIPRLIFHGSSYFFLNVTSSISLLKLLPVSDDDPFLVPGFPHRIEMRRSQMPDFLTSPPKYVNLIADSLKKSHGMVMNTFYELEPAHADAFRASGMRSWNVGPVSLCHRPTNSLLSRGGAASEPSTVDRIFPWLDSQEPGSVLYICFGSLAGFTAVQVGEIGKGLAAAGRPYLWVVRDGTAAVEVEIGEGRGKGLVISGWVPQVAILGHVAVGAFMTHCEWNSCTDGMAAGLPMITWPLAADQPFNERLLVDVLGLGVGVGSLVNSWLKEKRTVVPAERLAAAVEGVMGGGEEAEARRRRAREMKEKAAAAVAHGGSSQFELARLVDELVGLKAARLEEEEAQ